MAGDNRIELLELLRKAGHDGDIDVLAEAVRVMVQVLMELDVQRQVGAARYERSGLRTTHRDAYRAADPGAPHHLGARDGPAREGCEVPPLARGLPHTDRRASHLRHRQGSTGTPARVALRIMSAVPRPPGNAIRRSGRSQSSIAWFRIGPAARP